MRMNDLKRKLTSRKFWMAITSFVSMLIIAMGGTESTAKQVAAIIMAGASVVAYVIGEGLADAGNVAVPLIGELSTESDANETEPS